jgi:genome maintenance exonuclease 1
MIFSKDTFNKKSLDRFFDYQPACLIGNEVLDLDVINGESGRFYVTPTGNHWPSMTTILGATSDKSGLDDWRERVGDTEANRIGHIAATRGTGLHEITEKYIRGDSTFLDGAMPLSRKMFFQIKPFLDQSLGTVLGIEQALYSDQHKTAGRSDLIAFYKGKRSVIDYKSSGKQKDFDWIQGYFIQGAGYGSLFSWMTGLDIEQIVILIGVEDSQHGQEFIVPFSDYKDQFSQYVSQYYNLVNPTLT